MLQEIIVYEGMDAVHENPTQATRRARRLGVEQNTIPDFMNTCRGSYANQKSLALLALDIQILSLCDQLPTKDQKDVTASARQR